MHYYYYRHRVSASLSLSLAFCLTGRDLHVKTFFIFGRSQTFVFRTQRNRDNSHMRLCLFDVATSDRVLLSRTKSNKFTFRKFTLLQYVSYTEFWCSPSLFRYNCGEFVKFELSCTRASPTKNKSEQGKGVAFISNDILF